MIYKIIFILLILICHSVSAKLIFEGIPKSVQDRLQQDHPDLIVNSPSPREVDQIIIQLMKSKLFHSVHAYQVGSDLVFASKNILKIKDVQFSGNETFNDSQMMEVIEITGGEVFERKRIERSAYNVQNFYGEQGFLNTKVDISYVNDGPNYVDLIVNIKENEPCQIKEIKVKSENNILAENVERLIKNYRNKDFSQKNINELESKVKNYLKEKSYLRSRFLQLNSELNEARDSAVLIYEIINPYNYELVISGNEKLTQGDLRREIGFQEFEGVNTSAVLEVEQRTKKLYQKRGFNHIKTIVYEKTKSDNFAKQVHLEIQEGPKVKIETLNVLGRISKPEKFYANFIKQNSTDLLKSGYYNRPDLELGYENLITFLRNNGFLDAKVHSARIDFNKNKDMAKIQIVMDEGPLTQIRSVRFKGAKDFSQEELSNIFNLKVNTPLRLDLVETSITSLRTFYANRGYLEMRLAKDKNDIISYNPKKTDATLEVHIYEGPKITVGSVIVEGNDFTNESVILNEIEINQGEILTQARIDQILFRLNRLGYFSRVNVRTLEEGTSLSQRTLIVSVSERDPGLFRTGIGLTSEDNLTVRGFLGVSYNNILGTGRGLSGRLDGQSNLTESQIFQRRMTLGYLEPYILESRTRGRVNLTYRLDEIDYKKDGEISQMRESSQLDLLLEREFTDQIRLLWTAWSLESERTFEIPASLRSTENNIAAIGPLLTFDYRNNPFLPTSGSFTRWETQYSNPFFGSSDGVEFFRSDIRFSFYIPVTKSGIVWANNISGGYLKNLSDELNGSVPGSRGFTLHGQSKIRGFGGSQRVEHIPNETQIDFDRDNIINIFGESQYYMLKTELRWPIPALDPLAMAVFYDMGAITFSDSDKQCTSFDPKLGRCVSTDPVRQSIGLGFHFNTPLGPIVIEIARKINPRIGERLDRLHFSIGSF